MKKLLLLFFLSLPVLAFAQQKEGDWYVLIAASTLDKNVGQAVEVSVKQAEDNAQILAKILNLELHVTKIVGNDFTPSKMLSVVQNFKTTPKSKLGKTMFTMMSFNHGVNFKNTWTRIPFMLLNPTDAHVQSDDQLIALEQVYDAVRSNQNFDHVHFWNELCDNIPNGFDDAPQAKTMKTAKALPMSAKNHLADLLYSVKSELMCSSSYGQFSITSPQGGAFSNSVFEAIELVANGKIAPKFEGKGGVFEQVTKSTDVWADKIAGEDISQIPQCYVLDIPKSIPTPIDNNVGGGGGQVDDGGGTPEVSLSRNKLVDVIESVYTKSEVAPRKKDLSKKSNPNNQKKGTSGSSWD